MARKVFLHIGLPKTGTTYLQQVLWRHRDQLRDSGVLLPGRGHREHLWAALDAQHLKRVAHRHPDGPGSWPRLVKQLAAWDGTGVVSHEFFCAASAEHAQQIVAALAPADVHLVLTARDSLGMLTAGWQESVKNGGTKKITEVGRSDDGWSEFGWRTWDLGRVLTRWGPTVPPERVHILPIPGRDEPADQHWRNFAGVLGLDPDAYQLPEEAANPSLGVVQVELLRRINEHLGDFSTAFDRGVWIRGYLAEEHLLKQAGERFGPGRGQVQACRRRAERAVALIEEQGYDVVGDVSRLLVPEELPDRTPPGHVTREEMLHAACALVADMLAEVRDSHRELKELRAKDRSTGA